MNSPDTARLFFAARFLDRRLRAVEKVLGIPPPERRLFDNDHPGLPAETHTQENDRWTIIPQTYSLSRAPTQRPPPRHCPSSRSYANASPIRSASAFAPSPPMTSRVRSKWQTDP